MAAIATKVNNAVPATKYAKVGDLISGNLTAFTGTNTITLTITDPTGDSAVINGTLTGGALDMGPVGSLRARNPGIYTLLAVDASGVSAVDQIPVWKVGI